MKRLIVIVAALVACAVGACRDASRAASEDASTATTPSRTGSCDRVSGMSICSEYTGGYLADNEAVLSSACRRLSGTFALGECPNTSVLGTCALSTSERRKFYASGSAAYDVGRAQRECVGSYRGTWMLE